MASKEKKLKEINEEKKKLNAAGKKLRADLNATKGERAEQRIAKAEVRKVITGEKADIRDLLGAITDEFSKGDADALNSLADELMELSTTLVSTIRKFAEASADPVVEGA